MPSPERIPHVRDLHDANRWAEDSVAVMLSFFAEALSWCVLCDFTISTAFSGVACSEIAAHSIALALVHFAASKTVNIRSLWALDCNQEYRYELRMLQSPAAFVFLQYE